MKKIVLLLLCAFLIPSVGFAASAVTGSGTSISDAGSTNPHPTDALSLSPNVFISYDSDGADSYALTGANNKGNLCYGVTSGDQGVYQKEIPVADGLTAADSEVLTAAEGTEGDPDGAGGWDAVGS